MAAQSLANIGGRISELLKARQVHQSALESIDRKLAQIDQLLGGSGGTRAVSQPRESSGRKRGSFPVSGEQMILNFVKKQGNPTTREINAAWKREGRGGTADTPLSKLVREKKLKRVSEEGLRGSRYEVV